MRNPDRHDSVRWRALLVALCLGIAALVAACGSSDDSGGGGGSGSSGGGSSDTKKVDMAAELKKPATITVWAWTPGTAEAVKMFEAAHPNIKVKLQNVGQGPPHYRKLRTVLKSGKGLPDVVHMEFQYIPSFTLTKSLLDMTPYLPDNFLSNYPEWVQKQINLQGGIYGVPWDTGPLGFIYRKDLLEKAGVEDADQHLGGVRHRGREVPQGQPEVLPGQPARRSDRPVDGPVLAGRRAAVQQ